MAQLIGWTSAYTSPYQESKFTEDKKQALVGTIKKRKYNFTYNDHTMLPYCAPMFSNHTFCVLTRPEWDEIMDIAYADDDCGARLLPMDVITRAPKNDILYEKEKFEAGDNNG